MPKKNDHILFSNYGRKINKLKGIGKKILDDFDHQSYEYKMIDTMMKSIFNARDTTFGSIEEMRQVLNDFCLHFNAAMHALDAKIFKDQKRSDLFIRDIHKILGNNLKVYSGENSHQKTANQVYNDLYQKLLTLYYKGNDLCQLNGKINSGIFIENNKRVSASSGVWKFFEDEFNNKNIPVKNKITNLHTKVNEFLNEYKNKLNERSVNIIEKEFIPFIKSMLPVINEIMSEKDKIENNTDKTYDMLNKIYIEYQKNISDKKISKNKKNNNNKFNLSIQNHILSPLSNKRKTKEKDITQVKKRFENALSLITKSKTNNLLNKFTRELIIDVNKILKNNMFLQSHQKSDEALNEWIEKNKKLNIKTKNTNEKSIKKKIIKKIVMFSSRLFQPKNNLNKNEKTINIKKNLKNKM